MERRTSIHNVARVPKTKIRRNAPAHSAPSLDGLVFPRRQPRTSHAVDCGRPRRCFGNSGGALCGSFRLPAQLGRGFCAPGMQVFWRFMPRILRGADAAF